MRKYFYISIICLICLCTSCKKDKLFDFDIKNIEANGDWGIPLLNDDIVLEKFLNKLDSVGHIHSGADGTISIVYESSEAEVFNFNTLFSNVAPALEHVDTSGRIPDITSPIAGYVQKNYHHVLSFSLASSEYKLKSAQIETCIMEVNFNLPINYSITLTSDQIFTPEGHKFTIDVSSENPTRYIDMAGYQIRVDDDQRVYLDGVLTVNHPGGTLSGLYYSCQLNSSNFQCNNVIAMVHPYPQDFTQSVKLNILNSDKFTIEDAYFNEPKITLHTINSFCNSSCRITKAETVESSGTHYSFLSAPCNIDLPYSGTSYATNQISNLSRFRINTNTDSLSVGGTFTLNPDGFSTGEILFRKTAAMKFKATTELPLDFSLENAVYADMNDNKLYHFISGETVKSIDELTIRLSFTNSLPIDLYPEIGFIDTVNNVITPLSMDHVVIHGSYDGNPIVHSPMYVTINSATAEKIINSHKLYIRFHFNTQGHDVILKTTQSVQARIGAKIKYSNIVLH